MKQDLLIYDKEYHLWRRGKYLGIATYINDLNIGNAFIMVGLNDTNEITNVVFMPDEWQFV